MMRPIQTSLRAFTKIDCSILSWSLRRVTYAELPELVERCVDAERERERERDKRESEREIERDR
jgi:hypothetical protein